MTVHLVWYIGKLHNTLEDIYASVEMAREAAAALNEKFPHKKFILETRPVKGA